MPTEPMAVSDVINELNTHWNVSNITKPYMVELTGAGGAISNQLRIDLNRADALIAKAGSPTFEETPIGNWKYVNRTYNVELEIQTKASRQQLYNLMREVRKICHVRRHSMGNFQRLQFQNFSEQVGEHVNVWIGTVQIQTTNDNVLAETS